MPLQRLSILTSAMALVVLVPCLAQEPVKKPTRQAKQGKPDPFAGPPSHPDDPFSNQPSDSPSRGSAEVKRVVSEKPGQATSADALSSTERIRAELNSKTSFRFEETTLAEAVKQLSESHEIPIIIDSRALEEIGLTNKERVNLSLKNVSLRSALRLLLSNLELTYMIRDEVLVITTEQSAEQNLILRVFSIPTSLIGHEDDVVKAVQAVVVPDIWDVLGGPATIRRVKNTLVVSATERVLEDVENFLEKLEAATKDEVRR